MPEASAGIMPEAYVTGILWSGGDFMLYAQTMAAASGGS